MLKPLRKTYRSRTSQTLFFLLALLVGMPFVASAQLHPGDIAFVGMNTDGSQDKFAFVALKNLPAGETIYFTDGGWDPYNRNFRPGEGLVGYTVPGGGVPAGSVIIASLITHLSSLGDQVIAYQSINGSIQPIAAINNFGNAFHPEAVNEHTSAVPEDLAQGYTAISIGSWDNAKYTGPTSGNKIQLLQSIADPQNWSGSNSYTQNFNGMSFSVTSGQPFFTMGEVRKVDESGNSVQVDIWSDQAGSHTVDLAVVGGTAGSADYLFPAPVSVQVSGTGKFTAVLSITDDTDCELTETIVLRLQNANGAQILANDLEIAIADNDAVPFSVFQGFEGTANDNWNYNINPATYNSETGPNPTQIVGQEAVWAAIKSFDATYFAPEGTWFWGMQGLDNNIGGGAFDHLVTFDPISLSGVSQASLSFTYFTYNSTPNDEIKYAVAFDNGTNWSGFITLPYNSAAWNTETIAIPPTATHVRLAIVGREQNGILCGGIDKVHLTGIQCGTGFTTTVGNIPTVLCLTNGNINIPFTSTGNYLSGNVFTAELSDANGLFANAVAIGSLTLSGTDPSGIIAGAIPANTPPGTGYRIRISSSSPGFTGPDNGTDLTLSEVSATLVPFVYGHGFHVSCPGSADGSIDLQITSGTGPFTYAWTGSGGFTATTEDVSGLVSGTYTVVITDAGGCSITETVLLEDPVLDLDLTVSAISCFGNDDGGVSANATGFGGPVTYTWTGPGGFSSNSQVLTGLAPGMYVVTVVDGNGCSLSDSAVVAEPAELSLSLNVPVGSCGVHVTCWGGSDGSIDLGVTGGTPPFSYSWTGPGGFSSSSQDLSGLGAGNYTVVVTDANGCTATTIANLLEPASMDAQVEAASYACGFGVSCNGASDGTAYVVGLGGGCPPYDFVWSTGATGQSASGLAAGVPYSVTITDVNGCAMVRSVTLSEPGALTVNPHVTPASCSAAENGSIFFPVQGGCQPYTFTWTGPNGFSDTLQHLDSLAAGVYNYTVVDANGCSLSGSITVNAVNNLSASIGCCQDTVVCIGETVDIEIELTGLGAHLVTWLQNGDTMSLVFQNGSTGIISVPVLETTTIELLSVTSTFSGCEGTVCGSVTIGANACGTPCEDICVNTGVTQVLDNGNCRSVTLEVACDTSCSVNVGSCPGTQVVSFDQDPFGNPIPAGTVVDNQWASMGVTFSFVNNNPNKVATGLIFDSSNPTGGDDDLGTPHQDFGGPGIGTGGAQGTPGENAVALGNLLIIAENTIDNNNDGLVDDPDDEAAGGELIMHFANPFYVESLSMVDLENGFGIIRVTQVGNQVTDFNLPGLGDNAVGTISIQMDSVVQMQVILPSSGGISALAYCPTSPGFMDVSVPCGNVTNVSNNAGLQTEIITRDSVTGITGIRVHGLPSDCIDSTGLGTFQLSYDVCGLDSACGGDFCVPLVAYNRNGCTQYEMAVMGQVAPSASQPPSKDDPVEARVAKLEVYPNPLGQDGNLKLYLPEGGFAVVNLYSMGGHQVGQVFKGEVLADEEIETSFRVGDLPSGIYILRAMTDRGDMITKQVVITH